MGQHARHLQKEAISNNKFIIYTVCLRMKKCNEGKIGQIKRTGNVCVVGRGSGIQLCDLKRVSRADDIKQVRLA